MSTHPVKHGVPAIFSFFVPGLGQIVKGDIAKGILFFVLFLLSVMSIVVLIGIILAPVIWLWSIVDAYNAN